ncbi:tyrosine-type recombinase/integrase [Sphingomonas sp. IC-56]|uniref:tyrosine-type recombinase/integrase n=1 Tax=Sphingomonas sp. IC-56 TaxID=2898529 RepID=UPI001E295BA4|nr:site-specific integrase [Sphingomonas sp. IC-56]MCD2324976.1 tyrosine-type recombinase/integrase [Sphingomonas sp. IC-56]
MRIKLKGLNKASKKLADGTKVTYYYAWRGGPRLEGSPGSPEFLASYSAAIEAEKRKAGNNLRALLDAFQDSHDFTDLADSTRADYRRHLRIIDAEYGDFPAAALEDRRTRGEFMAWRDRLAIKSRRQADYTFAVLKRVLSWSLDRGLASTNPCTNAGRVYRGGRSERIWTTVDEEAFYNKAPPHLHLALTLALWTGQRQGDLLALRWGDYDGTHIRLIQRKSIRKKTGNTGKRIVLPVGAPLKEKLDTLKPGERPKSQTVLLTERGTPWTGDGFRTSWGKACRKAGITGLTFHDLRGTAVTRLALAGATPPEIATFTGHSLRDISEILDAHYLNRDPRLAEAALRKLETG